MYKYIKFLLPLIVLYSCAPVNKQHGYLLDDILISSEKMSEFETNVTSKSDIYETMGSPSVEIDDVNKVWIYLVSLKEKKVFEEDSLLFQNIFRFVFNEEGILINQSLLTVDDFQKISFSSDKTNVDRNAYGITDQLYEAFTRGQ